MPEQLTKQQIYDRIRESSKDSYILEEMQRLGFWESSSIPSLSEILIKREAVVTKELNELLAQDRRFQNQEAMLKEMRKERMKKAKENRELTKQKNKQKCLDKAARWKQLQQQQIIYLGKGVSYGLNNTEANSELLKKFNLPTFNSLTELADNMKIDLSSLRYLLYQRKVSKTNHYHSFSIQKKSGGLRKISAPKKKLKMLQNWILENILEKIPIDGHVHGFVKKRSIITNALPHIGQEIVVNVDLKDFFPTISYKRVKGLFQKLGYSEQMSIIFALICTQADTETIQMDGITYYVEKGDRVLPQGSPASPAISNLIAYRLDKKVNGLATKLGFAYTRYADDLSFSTTNDNGLNVARLLYFLEKITIAEGLVINPNKTHVMRKGRQQKVTGIIVNKKINVERNELRRFRALLHNIETRGWQDQKWGKSTNLIHSIEGYINFVKMVNSEKSNLFEKQLKRIIEKHGYPTIEQKYFPKKEVVIKETIENTTEVIPRNDKPIEKENNNDWWDIFS